MTMDEMRVSAEGIDGQTNVYYDGKEVVIPDAWRKLERQNWKKDVIAAKEPRAFISSQVE